MSLPLNISTDNLHADISGALAKGDQAIVDLDYNEAEERYNEALEAAREKLGRDHMVCALIHYKLGLAIQARDDDEDDEDTSTETHYLRALAIMEQQLGPFHVDLLPVLYCVISIYDQVGLGDKAERYGYRVREINEAERRAKNQI